MQCSLKEADRIAPEFIYNRYDLWGESVDGHTTLWRYQDKDFSVYFESLCKDNTARLGIWLMPMKSEVLHRIARGVFHAFPYVKSIVIENATCDFRGRSFQNNHFRIELPKTVEELDQRLSSKGRYNIRREKRLLSGKNGGYVIRHYLAGDRDADKVWSSYFKYKSEAKKTIYDLTPDEYCAKYHVTDVYSLELGDRHDVAAMMLSCEQCSVVYLENMAFDETLASFSPGQILYDEYLKLLIQKGKKELFLAGGDYSYKKRYDSVEDIVFKGVIYRNKIRNNAQWANCHARRAYHAMQRCLNKTRKNIKRKRNNDESLKVVSGTKG